MAAYCDATMNACSIPSSSEPRRKKLVSARTAQLKHAYYFRLKNQPESLIYDISLMPIGDNSIKLLRVGEPNHLTDFLLVYSTKNQSH